MTRPFHLLFAAALTSCALLCIATQASAQSTIKRPGAHPHYVFEAEPHLAFRDRGHGSGFGPGFRGTIVVADDGFISKINDSVGVGFGLDWLVFGDRHCHGNLNNNNPNDDYCHHEGHIALPVVMQWNFWLHRKWSVFGEPGFALILHDEHENDDLDFDPFVFYAGGRFHFSDSVTLTMRIGFPATLSVGVSFLL